MVVSGNDFVVLPVEDVVDDARIAGGAVAFRADGQSLLPAEGVSEIDAVRETLGGFDLQGIVPGVAERSPQRDETDGRGGADGRGGGELRERAQGLGERGGGWKSNVGRFEAAGFVVLELYRLIWKTIRASRARAARR